MPNYKLTVEYDGSDFVGWQAQENGNSIQKSLEISLNKLCNEKINVYGAGRTDSGVHAEGQVAHFKISKEIPTDNIRDGANKYLRPLSIAVLEVEKVSENFHARFSAKKRVYEYKIINRKAPLTIQKNKAWIIHKHLDFHKMKEASIFFEGKHDFNAFRSINCQSNSSIKTIDQCSLIKEKNLISLIVSAKSFLHSQVRIMVGTLANVGEGKIQPFDLNKIIEMKDRNKAGVTAPAHGLYLKEVIY